MLAFLAVAAILIVSAIYIGIYVLFGLLILGAAIGGLTAVYALCKAIPQTVNDMSRQIYHGNRIGIALKKAGYFFVCIAKYSMYNDLQYARSAYQKFQAKKPLSFSKWINLALAITLLFFGLLTFAAILLFAVLVAVSLIILALNLTVITVVALLGVSFLGNLFFSLKDAMICGRSAFFPICFKFKGRCRFSDLLSVPRLFLSQIGIWIRATWQSAMQRLSNYKTSLNTGRFIWFPIFGALILSCPIAAALTIALALLLLVVVSLLVYFIDAVWILIKAIFKF